MITSETTVKHSWYQLAIALVLLILITPSCLAAGTAAAITSAAGDATGTPPQELSSYIGEAQDAIKERNWSSALLITTRGLKWYPESADLLCPQGYSYRKIGQFQKSVEIVSRSIPLDPTPVRYANRGYGYLALKNSSAALADAEAGILLDGNYTTNHAIKALALLDLGRNDEALSAIETALSQSPDGAHYWHVKGRILADGGDCTDAASALERSLALNPDYSLPYPGFGSASEDLEALKTVCASGRAPGATTPPKSPSGWIVVLGIPVAVMAFRNRK